MSTSEIDNIVSVCDIMRVEAPRIESCGKLHECLSMKLDFTVKGKSSSQFLILLKYSGSSTNEMAGVAVTPAYTHLYEVKQYCTKLSASGAESFQHNVASLLL